MVETKPKAALRPNEPVFAAFDEFERAWQGNTPSWVQALRKGGIAHFAELGYPTTEHEEWRFTNVASIARTAWTLADGNGKATDKDVRTNIFPDVPGKKIVFVDGHFSRELSSKDLPGAQGVNGLRIQSVHEAVRSTNPLVMHSLARYARYDENSFVALNTAFVHDGAVIIAPARFVAPEPVYILYLSTASKPNTVTHPRTLIIAQRDSQLKVIEHYVTIGSGTCFTNAVTEILLEESAMVEHCKVQDESLNT